MLKSGKVKLLRRQNDVWELRRENRDDAHVRARIIRKCVISNFRGFASFHKLSLLKYSI